MLVNTAFKNSHLKKIGKRAFQCKTDHDFFLKLAFSPVSISLLQREAHFLKNTRLRSVPHFVHYFESSDCSCLMTEWIEGCSLTSLRTNSLRPSALIRQLSQTIYRQINEVHHLGVVHCDITPENIKYVDGRLYFLDWEYYQEMKTPIANLPIRPLSLGWTHPRMIWGHGYIDTEIDLFSIKQILNALQSVAVGSNHSMEA